MSTWTDGRIKLLTTLASEGWSAGQIGEKLRISRNAVIGKIHRLGLSLSQIAESLGVKRNPPRPHKRAKPKPYHPPILESSILQSQPYNEPMVTSSPEIIEQSGPIKLMQLGYNSCRWPVNDGYPEYLFCGKPCDMPPYCDEHYRKAYSPQRKS